MVYRYAISFLLHRIRRTRYWSIASSLMLMADGGWWVVGWHHHHGGMEMETRVDRMLIKKYVNIVLLFSF